MIEQLESRTFLSVSADAGAIDGDAGAVESAFLSLKATGTANIKTLTADLKRIKASAGAKGIVNALKSHETADLNIVKNKGESTFKAIAPDVKNIVTDVKKLQANPTSASLEAKLTAAIKKLNAAAAGKQVVLSSDIQTVYTTGNSELNELATLTTDVQTQNDIATARSNLLTGATNFQNDVVAFFSAVTQLVTDAEA